MIFRMVCPHFRFLLYVFTDAVSVMQHNMNASVAFRRIMSSQLGINTYNNNNNNNHCNHHNNNVSKCGSHQLDVTVGLSCQTHTKTDNV